MVITKHAVTLPYLMKEYKLEPDSAIIDALAIPKFISKLGAFFPQVKPKKGNLIQSFILLTSLI